MTTFFHRFSIFKLLSIFFVGLSLSAGCSKKTPTVNESDKYNVLIVTLDTTRTEHLSCYGYKYNTSPNLDTFASQAIKFDKAIVQAAATPISHASILTGLNPYQHGVRVIYAASGYRLPETIPTLATTLGKSGWSTAAFVSSFTVSQFFGLDQGFDIFDSSLSGDMNTKMQPKEDGNWGWEVGANQRRSDKTTYRAIKWLKKCQKPFFMWVHYWDPHDNKLVPPSDIVEKYLPGGPNSGKMRSQYSQQVALYDAEIEFMDLQFGKLLKELKDNGQYNNTVIVVIADHGQGLDDGKARHGWYNHRLLYQEQIRVPMMIRYPNGPEGLTVSNLVRSIDIFPTIIDILDLSADKPVEGRSLLGIINNKPEPIRIAYADALNLFDLNSSLVKKGHEKDDLLYCAMDDSWKLIYRPNYPEDSMLFNLDTDPLETKNLFKKKPSQVKRLKKELDRFNGYVDKPFGKTPENSAAMEALRSLGYVDDN